MTTTQMGLDVPLSEPEPLKEQLPGVAERTQHYACTGCGKECVPATEDNRPPMTGAAFAEAIASLRDNIN